MFGLAGFPDALKNGWRTRVTRVVGIAWQEGMLYVAFLEWQQVRFEIAGFESVMLQTAGEDPVQSIAEKTAAMLARKGWEGERVALSVPESEVERFQVALPPVASAEERARMAAFEVVRQLHAGRDEFLSACAAGRDGRQEIAAIRKARAEALRKTFARAGLDLWALAAPGETLGPLCEDSELSWEGHVLPIAAGLLGDDGAFHDWDESYRFALYGPALLTGVLPKEGFVFPLENVELSSFAYGRMARMVAVFWFVAILACSSWDVYAWHAAKQAAAQQKAELALLYGDVQRMEDDRAETAWVETRDQALRRLTAEKSPAAGVLLHLGTCNVDGVRLDAVSIEQGRPVRLRGQAVMFDALSSYLQGFERDQAFFPEGPVLLESDKPSGEAAGTIHFSIDLALPSGEEDDAS